MARAVSARIGRPGWRSPAVWGHPGPKMREGVGHPPRAELARDSLCPATSSTASSSTFFTWRASFLYSSARLGAAIRLRQSRPRQGTGRRREALTFARNAGMLACVQRFRLPFRASLLPVTAVASLQRSFGPLLKSLECQ